MPGGIESPNHPNTDVSTSVFRQLGRATWVHMSELASTMYDQCINGITKDALWGENAEEFGSRILSLSSVVTLSHIIIGSGLDDDEAALDQDNWTIDADLAGVSNLALANMAYGADIKYVDGNWGEDGTGEIKR
ncbi:uncharacterized protein PADG_04997 [Paracoccidioides brasiliensis Pb18]|uniref:Uncharacterized protein n=1 Tax=Paracoccidioides brasiliensis (strain Pb18) TaxID=502780 RepID=C1GBJ6_PARBD|nr:uncharacterized protein PADG_04997 [Paracoccidioides brasiliensis Pb18]EEH48918.2 hypothetical protein PADG_04997 [Paracoccidioides brasiliensis Pb18]